MKPTETEQLLIDGLKLCGVSKGMGAAIFLTLETEENMLEMCDYIAEHKDVTADELLALARRMSTEAEAEETEDTEE